MSSASSIHSYGPYSFAWDVSGESPFLNQQIQEWSKTKPLDHVTILHYIPITHSTVRKVHALIQGGAQVDLLRGQGGPSEVENTCIDRLRKIGLKVFDNPTEITQSGKEYDYFLDCAGRLSSIPGKEPNTILTPKYGYVELTQSGLQYYKDKSLPVISIDTSKVKLLETILGTGEGIYRALHELVRIEEVYQIAMKDLKVVLFGYGKVGTGIARKLHENIAKVTVIEKDESKSNIDRAKRHFVVINSSNKAAVKEAIKDSHLIITATGIPDLMSREFPEKNGSYDPVFTDKILVNAGGLKEFGPTFTKHPRLILEGRAINFGLEVPTNTRYIDPVFVLHNEALLWIRNHEISQPGIHPVPPAKDALLFAKWKAKWKDNLDVIEESN